MNKEGQANNSVPAAAPAQAPAQNAAPAPATEEPKKNTYADDVPVSAH